MSRLGGAKARGSRGFRGPSNDGLALGGAADQPCVSQAFASLTVPGHSPRSRLEVVASACAGRM